MKRRDFLQKTGLGMAAVSSASVMSFLSGCSQEPKGEGLGTFWREGNFPPVSEEITETKLVVEGEIPKDLNGLYARNGPNSWEGPSDHFFIGDGMIHGLKLSNGEANWYRNRYVQTPLLYKETGIFLKKPELEENMSNVSLIHHGGKLLSLGEQGFPFEIDPNDLTTKGIHDYGGQLQTNMTAHPKIDPETGDLHFFGYDVFKPYLRYMRANPAGELVQVEPIELNAPVIMHDFAITKNYVIFMELPIVFSWLKVATLKSFPFGWDDNAIARMGVMPKNGGNKDIKWFNINPCFIFHTINAFERGEEVVMDAARYERLWVKDASDFNHPAYATRFAMNMKTGKIKEERINDHAMEFPQVNRESWGRPYRYAYALASAEEGQHKIGERTGFLKYDHDKGTYTQNIVDKHLSTSEPFFVSNGPGEDDGYLLSYMYDANTKTSDLWIMDAHDITAEPLAKIKLPVRVPQGFHGVWLPVS